jgi:hypothetical protein
MKKTIFIEPSCTEFYQDKIFESSVYQDPSMAIPLIRAKEYLNNINVAIHTADYFRNNQYLSEVNEYWSMGIFSEYKKMISFDNIVLKGFLIMEPPLVAPKIYRNLPEISRCFDKVYLNNTSGDGYSLDDVILTRLEKFYWPQPYGTTVEPQWSNVARENKIVVIAGNHNPKFRRPEYYSKRIEAISTLSKYNCIDLYGRGWLDKFSKRSAWIPYWKNYKNIISTYKGSCESKIETLSKYNFCLCLENSPMEGYITEKIFDCFYAGTIPLYLGAPDIADYINPDSYIDLRNYGSWDDMWNDIKTMSNDKLTQMRNSGKEFLLQDGIKYTNSMINLVK